MHGLVSADSHGKYASCVARTSLPQTSCASGGYAELSSGRITCSVIYRWRREYEESSAARAVRAMMNEMLKQLSQAL